MRPFALAFALCTIAPMRLHGQNSQSVIDLRQAKSPTAQWTTSKACKSFGASSADLPDGVYRVTGATRLTNGTIVVASNMNVSLFYFDSTGRFVRRAGGRGGGPGEIEGPAVFIAPYRGDSVLAYGVATPKATVFGPTGLYGRSFVREAASGRGGFGVIAGTSMRDGTIATVTRARSAIRAGEPDVIKHDSVTIHVFGPAGAELRTIGPIPDVVSARSAPKPTGGGRMVINLTMQVPGAVSRWNGSGAETTALNGGPLYHFEEGADALVGYDGRGIEQRRILLRPLDARLRPHLNANVDFKEAQILSLASDREGRAWVEVARERSDGDRKWWVFDANGQWLAEATTPPYASKLLEIGANYILLLKKDQDDIETISLCPMSGMK